ncbi:SGNH/GDSL hydrolase family protein [Curtobacterium sp. L1-20]|uniref:SGNH/GDSL hydrolase family protein n=1 Tax=Curtobacterium sp. L1-20 TaxID=3138181 RepID=UPI003B526B6E
MPRVAFYGDSIVTGWRGISATNKRWTTTVSESFGWCELNVAINGVGFVRRRGGDRTDDGEALGLLSDVLASGADGCVVALGGNDSVIVLGREDEVRAAVARDLRALVQHFPDGALAVLDLYSPYGSDYPPGWKAVRQILQEETHRVGLQLVPGLATAINHDEALLCPDGVHPNDAGHAALADSIEPHLRAALFG